MALQDIFKTYHEKNMKKYSITSYEEWNDYACHLSLAFKSLTYVATACRLELTDEYLLHAGFVHNDRTTFEIIHKVKKDKWHGIRPDTAKYVQFPKASSYADHSSKVHTIIATGNYIPIYSYTKYDKASKMVFIVHILNKGDDLYQIYSAPQSKDWSDFPESVNNLILVSELD